MKKLHQVTYLRKRVPIALLGVYFKDAQRSGEVQEANVLRIMEDFDPDKLGVIYVSPLPNGKFHIIDGRHRIEALKRLGFADSEVLCEIRPGDKKAAAELFIGIHTSCRPQAADRFRVAVTAERPIETAVNEIIERHGYRVSISGNPGTLSAVAACCSIYAAHGPEALDAALGIIKQAWGDDRDAVNAHVLKGFGIVCGAFNGELDRARFAARLAKDVRPAALPAMAKNRRDQERGSLSENVAHILINQYNRNRRTGRLSLDR